MSRVLIDTSAWIEFFQSTTSEEGNEVAGLIESDNAALTGPVLMELLHAAGGRDQAKQLRGLLDVLPFVEVEQADWEEAGEMLRKLREKGLTVPPINALIGTVAKRRSLGVLTLDNEFEQLDPEG
jgi:predicted nucleic acid-binding protein